MAKQDTALGLGPVLKPALQRTAEATGLSQTDLLRIAVAALMRDIGTYSGKAASGIDVVGWRHDVAVPILREAVKDKEPLESFTEYLIRCGDNHSQKKRA